MGDSTKSFSTPLSEDTNRPCDRDCGLIKKVLHKIDSVNSTEEYHKLIGQSSRKGTFSVSCAKTISAQSIKGGGQIFTKEHHISTALR
jgi:hypothetical protein